MNNYIEFWLSSDSPFWNQPKTFLIQENKIKSQSQSHSQNLSQLEDTLWKRVLENEQRNPELKKLIIEKKK